jgi:predicted small secreted protein
LIWILLGTTAATAVITAIATAALVVILFVLLEFTLAGCRTEISSYTFNF